MLGDGRAFYAMERVRGRGLDEVIAEATTLRARIALLPHAIAVADALAYAHSERIVHRDLKPSNVLIGPFGETVVIDWGLAKDLRATELDAPAAHHSADMSLTRVGSVLGTPSHMAPEQARGEPSDERSDVYAIGALLYHMLTGAPPHDGPSVDEVLQRVSAGVHVPILERAPQLPPELAAIVNRAMATVPADRFATAKELADELRRYASGQLVASHSYSLSLLLRRWLWKHRAAVSIAGVSFVVVAVVGILTLRAVLRAHDTADEASRTAAFHREIAAREPDDVMLAEAQKELGHDPSAAAAQLGLLTADGIQRAAAHDIAARAAELGLAWELRGHTDDVEHLVVAHDGGHVATASDDATIRWWSLADPATVVVLRGHTGAIDDLVISHDDRHLASAGTDADVWLWDPVAATGRRLAGHTRKVHGIAFSPDSTELVSTSDDGTAWLWSVATGTGKVLTHYQTGLRAVAWAGDQIIVGGHDGTIGRFDPKTGKGAMAPAVNAEVRSLAVSPDGRYYASADKGGEVVLWKLDGTRVARLGSHMEIAREVVFAPDGRHLASCGGDNLVRVYGIDDGTAIELAGNVSGIKDIDISPDGALVAAPDRHPGPDAALLAPDADRRDHVARGKPPAHRAGDHRALELGRAEPRRGCAPGQDQLHALQVRVPGHVGFPAEGEGPRPAVRRLCEGREADQQAGTGITSVVEVVAQPVGQRL